MKKFDYYQPESLKEAYGLMEKHGGNARYIAGGTDIIWRIKQGVIEADALISLRGIESLAGITLNGDLTLGSMALFRDIERDSAIISGYPSLAQAVSVLANPQVRNVATVGGNLCNGAPSADCAPPLMVLEAVLTLEGPGGKREVPVSDFFTGPGQTCMDRTEVLTQIKIPKMTPDSGTIFLKKGRVTQDIAIVNAAALLVMEGKVCRKCRLTVGAVASVPLRLTDVEELVEGQEIAPELLDRVQEMVEHAVTPITDVRSTEEYRRTMSGVLIKRAIKAVHEIVCRS
ncbi:MAG: xanthine dehydrogenase family protein subunit M [Deltaproteobacteria bacterium]|nr:xanthine dehydrogenase family protein subunit M [Deltaproteobacteria bacterium]